MTFPHVAASVMAADLTRLGDEIRAMDAVGIDAFHWDIMDGHFVPNFTFGPDTVKALRLVTKTFFDVHLMVDNPADYIDAFADAGANAITFHAEIVEQPEHMIAAIKARSCEAGIAFNPETEMHLDASYVALLDRVLIMTVNPGFGGQKYIDMSDKIKKAALIKHEHPHLNIIVDGGINATTAPRAIESGASTLVSGSALFGQKNNYAAALAGIKGGRA